MPPARHRHTHFRTGAGLRRRAPAVVLLLTACALCMTLARAEDEPPADTGDAGTAKRPCEFCPPPETGTHGELEAGLGFVSDDSFRFGDYSGLDDNGLFFVGNAELRHRGPNAGYFDLFAGDVGLDSRSLSLEGGRQGSYRLFLQYRELPKLRYDTAVTPFNGEGSDTLTLPAGWTPAGTTGGMSDLAASLHDVDIQTRRRRLDLGASIIPAAHWEYAAHMRHETKKGIDSMGGAFLIHSAILPEPVDYSTDQIDLSASYTERSWQARVAYYGSLFRNEDGSLTWDNPYTPLAAGADRGRLALAPDNQFHQLLLSGAFQPSDRTAISGNLAVGRMEQDDDFLPATINPNLMTALPRDSLEGRVNTLTANLRANHTATPKLRLNAEYRYNDRDNKTSRDSFTQVQTDVFVAAARSNLPYSYTNSTFKLGGDYQHDRRTRLSAGLDHETRERSLQKADRSTENTLWGKLRLKPAERLDLLFNLALARRDGGDFEPVPEIQPPENPRHRAFNLADRDRDSTGMRLTYTPRADTNLGFTLDYAKDDYSDSEVGLLSAKNLGATADVSMTPHKHVVVHGFIAHNIIESQQAGSQAFGAPDWSGKNQDTTRTLGVGVERRSLFGKYDVGAQYSYAKSKGEVSVDNGAGDPPFPDLKTRLHLLALHGSTQLRPDVSLKLGYRYERYSNSDWQLDDVAPATIPNVLSLGQGSPSYGVSVLTLSLGYQF